MEYISIAQAIDEHFSRELAKHEDFIDKLRSNVDDNMTGDLLEIFKGVAKEYHTKARELFNTQLIKEEGSLSERNIAFGKVMERIRKHDALLSRLSQAYPPVSLDSTRDLMKTVIGFLSTQLKSEDNSVPVLKPLIGTDFSYIHFKYTNGALGIITVPPEFCIPPADEREDWPVIWHEVAGHAIATRREAITAWAVELRMELKTAELWHFYQNALIDSYAGTLTRRLNEFLESTAVVKIEPDLDQHVPEKNTWQISWLGEFLEDLFFIRVFVPGNHPTDVSIDEEEKRAPIDKLIDALSKTYPDPTEGDHVHPPPGLRVFVALAYLHGATTRDELDKVLNTYLARGDLYRLLQLLKSHDYQDLALIIAGYCKTKMDELYKQVSESELRLARFAIGRQQPQDARSEDAILAELSQFAPDDPPSEVEKLRSFAEEISICNLDDLLKLQFTDRDPDRLAPPFPWG